MRRESSECRDNFYFYFIFWRLLYFRFTLLKYHPFIYTGFKCRSLSPNLTSVLLVGENAESHENVIAFPSSSPLACHSPRSRNRRRRRVCEKSSQGCVGLWRGPGAAFYESRGTNCASREKFMASFHLTLSYRRDGAIIAGMGRYLKCRKVADGLSPLTRRGGEGGGGKKGVCVISQSTFLCHSKVEMRD